MGYFDELRNAIIQESPKLGLNPVDVANIFSYETGGTFDPWKAGPTTQWGQHFGLFQAGGPQREKYGIKQGMPVSEQVKAFFRYLPDHGVKYGDDISRVYAAVNAGSANKLLANDRGSSVLDKVNKEFPAHRLKALALLNRETEGFNNYDNYMGDIAGGTGNDIQLGNTAEDELEQFAFALSGGAAARPDSVSGFQPGFRSQLEAMIRSAPPNVKLGIMSGYRSPEVQAQLWANALKKYGSPEAARKWVAPPGKSNHGRGTAADLTFGTPEAREWAHANAAKFGLGFRMGHEPWHIEPLDGAGGGDVQVAGGTGNDVQLGGTAGEQLSLINPTPDPMAELNMMEQSLNPITKKPIEWSQPMPVLEDLVKDDPETLLEQLGGMAGQVGAGATDVATSLPWKLAAGLVAPGEWLGRQASQLINPEGYDPDTYSITDELWNRGVQGGELSNEAFGVDNPGTFGEMAARMGPANLIMPGSALAKTAATEAITAIQTFGPNLASGLRDFVFGPAVASAPDPTLIRTPPGHDKEMWSVLGPLGLVTGLAAGFPYIMRGAGRAKTAIGWTKPKWQDVPDGPTGSIKMANWRDVLNTMGHDSWHGITEILTRAGLPKQMLSDIDDVLKINTRSGAKSLASGAIVNGHVETLSKQFNVKVPIAQIEKAVSDQPVYGQYLNVLDVLDRFRLKNAPARIQGFTRAAATKLKTDIEKAHPKSVDLAKAYQEHVTELKKFVTSGQYGINSRSIQQQFAGRPNLIPSRNVGEGTPNFPSNPASEMSNYTHAMFVESLHNEARGTIINGFKNSPFKEIRDGAAVEIDAKQLKAHPEWMPNVVKVNEGKTQKIYHIGDDFIADMMHIDPFEITGQIAQGVHGLKRVFEMFTTGVGNPAFAGVSFIRNWGTALATVPKGYKGPGLINPILAIPRQVLPIAAKAMAANIDAALMRDNSAFWGSMPGTSKALSAMLTNAWQKSYLGQMEKFGAHAGTYLDEQMHTVRDWNAGLTGLNTLAQNPGKAGMMGKSVFRTVAALGRGWAQLLYATHGAPQFAVARRNMRARPAAQWPHIVKMASELTGNPRQGGQAYVRTPRAGERADNATGARRQVRGPGIGAVKTAVAGASEFARTATPWFPPISQGISAMTKAYWKDPIRFTGRLWAYMIAPTIGIYMYNRGLGPEYNQYQMEGRSNLKKATSLYIGDPNKPPEEGYEIPIPQELSALKAMAETMAHYSLPSTNKFGHAIEEKDALWDIADNFLFRVMLPPPSIIETASLSARGVNPPSSIVGDDVYLKREEAFDQLGSPLPLGIESFLKSTGGALGQLFIESLQAFSQTEGDFSEAMNNGMDEMVKGQMTRVPFGSFLGAVSSMTMDTPIHQELVQKHQALQTMSDFWDQWGKDYLEGNEGRINLKPPSKEGEKYVERAVGDLGMLGQEEGSDSAPYPGMTQPPPNDPLYIAIMKEIHDKLMTDTKGDGLKGFISLNRRLGNVIDAQRSVKQVNSGNFVEWAKRVQNDPEIQDALGGLTGKDKWDPERAGNYLQKERNRLERQILMVVKDVEQDLSKRARREIKLEDLSPYK